MRVPEDTEDRLERDLNPEHLHMLLQGSGISPEVVRARGYRTVENGRRDQVPHAVGGPWRLFLLLEPMLILPPAR